MKITSLEVKRFERLPVEHGRNWVGLVILNGEPITVLRQGGGLGIWSFMDRHKFPAEELRYLDEVLDEELRRHQAGGAA